MFCCGCRQPASLQPSNMRQAPARALQVAAYAYPRLIRHTLNLIYTPVRLIYSWVCGLLAESAPRNALIPPITPSSLSVGHVWKKVQGQRWPDNWSMKTGLLALLAMLLGHPGFQICSAVSPDPGSGRTGAFHGYSEKGRGVVYRLVDWHAEYKLDTKLFAALFLYTGPTSTHSSSIGCRDLNSACSDWAEKGECPAARLRDWLGRVGRWAGGQGRQEGRHCTLQHTNWTVQQTNGHCRI
jgi:hypothetical protein